MYYELCKLGGSKSFIQLMKTVSLKNPFEPETLKAIMPKLEAILKELEV